MNIGGIPNILQYENKFVLWYVCIKSTEKCAKYCIVLYLQNVKYFVTKMARDRE